MFVDKEMKEKIQEVIKKLSVLETKINEVSTIFIPAAFTEVKTQQQSNKNELLVEIKNEQKNLTAAIKTVNEELKILETDDTKTILEKLSKTTEIVQDVSKQHKEFHGDMLEKLNQAGELIVGYETFYENSLAELDEIFRFVDILSKRPAVSSDPDFANFVRAVQLMTETISKYSTVSDALKRNKS